VREGAAFLLVRVVTVDGGLRGDIERQAVLEIIYRRKTVTFTTRTLFTITITSSHISVVSFTEPIMTILNSGAIAAVPGASLHSGLTVLSLSLFATSSME